MPGWVIIIDVQPGTPRERNRGLAENARSWWPGSSRFGPDLTGDLRAYCSVLDVACWAHLVNRLTLTG